jgi:serine/threonine protein kinase
VVEVSKYNLETLRQDGELILCRARSIDGQAEALVLSSAGERPSPESLRRLENEYSLREELDPTWAARPLGMVTHGDRAFLVLHDPGGVPLNQLVGPVPEASAWARTDLSSRARPAQTKEEMSYEALAKEDSAKQPLDIALVLRLAVSLSAGIGALHRRGIVHKEIKPANVLANPATGQCWLTGFGIASRLPRERQPPGPPNFIAGSLPYMAPEQTGRMNRSIDSRSDLYALGVTLYEMLTGALPFSAADPMEWVHCHIARQAVSPSDRLNRVPTAVSAIVMKLLAKTAEERYQTAAGVEFDLRRCLADWESVGHIDPFPLAGQDISDRLLVPEKLYGRDAERKVLLDAFDRVAASGKMELVLVSGYSGIGKSSIVYELGKTVVLRRGIFISGKVDQQKRDIPYYTFAQAFQGLVRQILSKSEEEVGRWRDAIREVLGTNGQLIVNLVPELELIIGQQSAVPDLPLEAAQNR